MENGLLKSVVAATGLPEKPVQNELSSLIARSGLSCDDLTLDELREVMAEYLNLVFLEMAQSEDSASA